MAGQHLIIFHIQVYIIEEHHLIIYVSIFTHVGRRVGYHLIIFHIQFYVMEDGVA